ncbi:Peptidyl-prolyl cis-trans isomerase-like 1 [Coemansia sp. RSA 25]|nr:Peptidyl-prolyl cis-trans isomerase-like 1 [Coemansia sp. RSA 25]
MSAPSATEEQTLPRVFFNVWAGEDESLGRIEMELFSKELPKTTKNFLELCTFEHGYGYKGSTFHRIIPNFMLQGGDFTNHNGTGGKSIYGKNSPSPECCRWPTLFFITTVKCPWLDGKHVVFGKVIRGIEIVKKIEGYGSESGTPKKKVWIKESGVL